MEACNDHKLIAQVFGGLNKYGSDYGLKIEGKTANIKYRYARPTGVATEVYNQVLSVLSTQCMNLNGRFVEHQSASNMSFYNSATESFCTIKTYNGIPTIFDGFKDIYGLDMNDVTKTEYICPRNYDTAVDTLSWGMCSCWENGGRRSQNNYTTKCVEKYYGFDEISKKYTWIDSPALSSKNQVCVYYVQSNIEQKLEIKCLDERTFKCCTNGDATNTKLQKTGVCTSVNCSDNNKDTNCCNQKANICTTVTCPSFENVNIDYFPEGI
jgi:hypothetical protein